ncbi:MAG: hypothetical protein ABSG43_00340 [Solirubrobacteraceae bacterium]|jgi:hypothetical protein
MSAEAKPKLEVADDPLGPRPAATPSRKAADKAAKPAKVETKGVFGRVPVPLARRMDGALFDLRDDYPNLTVAELLAALLSKHVDRDAKSLAALKQTIEDYRTGGGR